LTQVVMQKPPEPVPLDGTFAHLVADDQGAAAGSFLDAPQLPAKQVGITCSNAQNHQGSVLARGGPVQTVEASMPAQSHGGGKDHQPILFGDAEAGVNSLNSPHTIKRRGGRGRACGAYGSHDGRCGSASVHGNPRRASSCGLFPRGCAWSWTSPGYRPI
jgi:hypothetical protein